MSHGIRFAPLSRASRCAGTRASPCRVTGRQEPWPAARQPASNSASFQWGHASKYCSVTFTRNMISCFPDMSSGVLAPPDRAVAARFFRVLGDPTRLHILELLEEGELSVGQLVAAVGQPQPRVSTHLACLRHCGFVRAERRGKEIVYSLALRGLDRIAEQADSVLEPIAERLATCTRIGPDWV